uniref:Receptor-like serine/threonine-protein kinase n=1 Tax=Davidia involucrata TaxID=16924 RepID=A0A5B7BIU9_DAVIN
MRTSMEGFSTILVFLLYLFSILIISNSVDTITTARFIADDGKSIVSSGGGFELGFFSPGSSKNRYLGIWYKKIPDRTVVWVANREIPLNDTSGVLKVTSQGILTLVNRTNSIIWSSNTTSSSSTQRNPVAQLLDSGNLVVRDSNDENFLWQSFDYPCDTLLPGMKLGKNLVTGLDWSLSSWKSSDDPSHGDFTYRCNPRGYPQYFLSNGSVVRFRSGPWNGLHFSGAPNLKPNLIFKFDFVFNKQEVYIIDELLNRSVVSRFMLNQDGYLQRWTWVDPEWVLYLSVPVDHCDFYGLCGPYGSCNINNSPVCGCLSKFVPKYPKDWDMTNWSSGCVRKTPLDCQNGDGDGFLKYPDVKLPDTQHSWFKESMSLRECKMACLQNCSCMAYANSDVRRGGSGCLLWFGDLIDIREFPGVGQDVYIRMASSESASDLTVNQAGSKGKKTEIIIVSLAITAGTLLLGLSLTLYVRKKKKKKNAHMNREGRMGHIPEQGDTNESRKEDLELPLFDLTTIVNATDNFSINNKLGEGGFGLVYKGMLEEGREVAVKRLSKSSSQGLEEFKNEVVCIAKLQHRNLVKLLGCCIQGKEKMLVYEYMPNKSLDSFIFDQTQSKLLDWPKRFHIINGIARGLLYLHQDSRLRIIHRDLKASNILLDVNMNPKISDFGMARSFGGNETEANTNRVVGTYGYMSPEYAVDGLFSVKSDVFSFGVLVLEIISGKKNRGFTHQDHQLNLLGHAWRLFEEGRSLELIDAFVSDSCYLSEVLRSIHVGLLCVQQSPEDRPSMSSVVLMLGSEGALLQPKQPGFFTERKILEADCSSNKHTSSSANELTITRLEAR